MCQSCNHGERTERRLRKEDRMQAAICDEPTRRFDEEIVSLEGVALAKVSEDLHEVAHVARIFLPGTVLAEVKDAFHRDLNSDRS